MKKIFAVILNWNQPDLTIDCVKSLKKLKLDKKYELTTLVIDNGSTDDSVQKIKKIEDIQIIEIGKNLGFTGGNNIGIKFALEKNSDFILILNNDTLVDKESLAKLLEPMEKDANIGVTSPKIYFAKGYEFQNKYKKSQLGKVIWYAGGKIDWKNIYGENIGVDEVDKGQFNKEKEIDFATGACFLARSKALEETGLFNEKYFMYLEDVDLSMRLKKKGWKIIYVPKAVIYHKVAQSSGIGSGLNDYFITRNRLLFGFKYASLRTKIALIRESVRLFIFGRHWQAVGVRDFYLRKFGKGSWT